MRRILPSLCAVVLAAIAAIPAHAGPLDTRHCEWAFDINYTNQNGGGSATNLRLAWGWLFGQGYSELGVSGTYQKVEDTGFSDPSTSISIVGPFYAWNWTPKSDRATGFLSFGAGAIAGDYSDVFDFSINGELGVRLFVGEAASVTAKYFFQSWQGSSTFIESEEFQGLAIGISLYTNRK